VPRDRVVYVGDGSSDIHVMLHVGRQDGFTIAVSESKYISQIAKRTILSDDALSVLVPILEDIVGLDTTQIRTLFEEHGFPYSGVEEGTHRLADDPREHPHRARDSAR